MTRQSLLGRAVLACVLLALAACERAAARTATMACDDPRCAPPLPVPAEIAQKVRLEKVIDGLAQPVGLVAMPGDATRLFVVEKGGRIRVLRGNKVDPAPVLDVSALVSRGTEQGLLGLAFHPKVAQNGRFFVNYTDRKGDTRVVEYHLGDDGKAEPQSARELLHVEQPFANHNGGDLVFGPDGLLYVGLGDGGSAYDPGNRAQNDKVLLGKMLVLDVNQPQPQPRIVAKGLRNPWRYSFDRATKDLYIADVGQDTWEWIHVVMGGKLSGENFGWNIVEGSHCVKDGCNRAGFTLPLVEYSHASGCSITGGYVYRGKKAPALAGRYFYSDFCTGLLRSFRFETSQAKDHWDWKKALDPKNEIAQVTTFGEDADGELYVVTLTGSIYRFSPAP